MNKEALIEFTKEIDKGLGDLSVELAKITSKYVNKKSATDRAQHLAKKWFEDVAPCAEQFGFKDMADKYNQLFDQLLSLSLKPSWKLTYQKTINAIASGFKQDVLQSVIKSASKINSFSNLANILEKATEEEQDYLNEALGCAKNGFLRASMVLVWCAAVNRMHKTVEKLGIEEFNKKSKEMKVIQSGRFKRFNKSFDLVTSGDLEATVFDNDLLWVLEYWQLIDANQHDRLNICFTMRNNAAHPGDATITEANLASAFSDIKTMVIDNPRFNVN